MRSTPSASTANREVKYVIEPNRAWLKINWSELSDRRDLLFLLFRRDHAAKYKQTILGPIWYILQPLATAAIFSVIFGRVVGISTEGVPRILFYLSGLLCWNYFSHNVTSISGTFTSNANLFGKVYFPRLMVPFSWLLSNLVGVALQFGVFLIILGFHIWFIGENGYGMSYSVALLPLLVLQTAALGLGAGLWLSSLTARYRDLKHALPFLLSSLMYLTPVIYPFSRVPVEFRWMLLLNPMAPLVETFRLVMLGVGSFRPLATIVSVAITAAVLLSGVIVFQRTERTVVDTI